MPARQASKTAVYRIPNWEPYTEALLRRGSLTPWVEQPTLKGWRYQGPNPPGAQLEYSDLASQCLLTPRALSHLTRRAAEGFACSLFELMHPDLPVPDSSTLRRRAAAVRITLPKRATGPLHLILDSTGLKVHGEGEWKVRQHGYSRRRTWPEPHLAIDPQTHEIEAAMVSGPGVPDAEVVPPWLGQVENPIGGVGADGMYDCRAVDEELAWRGGRAVIPPRRDARIQRHGSTAGPRLVRDENLRRIRRVGRAAWKAGSGDPRRSLGEAAMFRMRTLFGGGESSRRMAQQATEVGIRCRALNVMPHQGVPQSERVAA